MSSLFTVNPERHQGPMSPDARTHDEIVKAGRVAENTKVSERISSWLIDHSQVDMQTPITHAGLFDALFGNDRDEKGEKKPVPGFFKSLGNSYNSGREGYRKAHNWIAEALEDRRQRELDALKLADQFVPTPEPKPERINPERMTSSEVSGGGSDHTIFYTPPKGENLLEDKGPSNRIAPPRPGLPGAPKLIGQTKQIDQVKQISQVKALPPPPKGLPAPTREELAAARGRAAAQRASQENSTPQKSSKKTRGSDQR